MSTVDRFRLVRTGILNLYEYGDQVFELAGGRLLLRGHNTSGKTKALELLLPFCLDGDMSPRKLDPFAKASKDMRWNLVGCIEGDQRTGYVWCEFERLGAEGTERITALIGMKANANITGVQRWYAVIRGRRIGDDLSLRRGDAPLTKAELAAELGDASPLIATAGEYRRTLNAAVFGFPSDDAYQTMLTLMLELRRPHLSKALDSSGVTQLLSAALPEIDHELIRRLGDGLEQLEDMRRTLERLRRAHRRLDRFIADTYSAYARAVLRERGDALRGAETSYENAAHAHRVAAEATADARARAERVTIELTSARATAEEAEGALAALLASPEWRSVEAVEQLARRAERQRGAADTARDHAEHASADVVIAEAHDARNHEDLRSAAGDVQAGRERLRSAASASGFGRHAVLDQQLEETSLELWLGLAEAELGSWREILAAAQQMLAAVDRAERSWDHAKAIEESQQLRLRGGRQEHGAARSATGAAQEDLELAIRGWAAELRELPVAKLDDVLDAALAAGRPSAASPGDLWRETAQQRFREITAVQTIERSHRDSLTDRLRDLGESLRELETQTERAPERSASRPADRSRRAGMPLWRAVDFVPGVDDAAQAGLEAALEAAGLLDAWLTVDGSLLAPDTLDAVLVPSARTDGPGLSRILRSAADAPASLGRVLESITLADDALRSDAVAAVDTRGGFVLGPLRGRFAKPQADHIGTAARAAARERRREQVRAEIEATKRELATADAALAATTARAERLASEQQTFPSVDAVAAANRTLIIAEQAVDRLTVEHAEAVAATRRAHEHLESARGLSRSHAETAGLPSLLTAADLRVRVEAAARYADNCEPLARAVVRERALQARVAEERERLEALHERARVLAQAAADEATEARRLIAEHAEREMGLSADAGQLRQRRQTVDAELSAARTGVARLQEADKQAAITLAGATGDAAIRAEQETAARRYREAALSAFARLERVDVFRLALADDAPADHHGAADWTLTRALEVLRGIPAARLVRDSPAKLGASLARACSELDRDLAQEADMSVFTTLDADGVLSVRVRDLAAERSLPELTARLLQEIEERERTLTAEQRRVFGDALLEEIAAHLRARIHEVRTQVDEMNGILRHSATAAGRVVQLGWQVSDDAEIADVIPLIRKPASALADAERETLVTFFRARIDQARSADVTDDGGETTVRTLRDAFDYRHWFHFELWEGTGRERQRLTAKRHAVGSGGEQAVLVHLPLFAAAASLYAGAPTAPRLVMLDEALSGIDDDTRARVMGTLVDLDLDFVMTSHELWGTYHTVPSLAIYQLYREPGIFGVHTERFVWDGFLLAEEEQGELFRA